MLTDLYNEIICLREEIQNLLHEVPSFSKDWVIKRDLEDILFEIDDWLVENQIRVDLEFTKEKRMLDKEYERGKLC